MRCESCEWNDSQFMLGAIDMGVYVKHVIFHVRKHRDKWWRCTDCDALELTDLNWFSRDEIEQAFEHVYTHRGAHRL